MASKRYSTHKCVYCQQRQSTSTGDHIFARQFFVESARANLPKAPCCAACGAKKSADEHYLTTLLPFGARHKNALENLTDMVPKRLAKNQKLRRELSEKFESSQHGRPAMIPFDSSRLQNLFEAITVGLLWHTWRIYLPSTHTVQSLLLAPAGEAFFDRLFSFNAQQVSVDLGAGTFQYHGAQGVDPAFSVWRFRIYDGLQITGDRTAPDVVVQHIGCLTAPRDVLERFPLK